MFGSEEEPPVIDGIEAPVAQEETTGETVGRFMSTLEDAGITTGPAGLVLILLGLGLVAVFYWQGWLLAQATLFARFTEGMVVGSEYAPGGRYTPVIEYLEGGRKRRWVSDMVTPTDQTGRPVRLRIDGVRPEIVAAAPNTGAMTAITVASFLGAAGCLTAGMTGRVFGVLPLPFL